MLGPQDTRGGRGGRGGGRGGRDSRDSRDSGKRRRDEWQTRDARDGAGRQFVKFALYKENMDTHSALDYIGRSVNTSFGFAGECSLMHLLVGDTLRVM